MPGSCWGVAGELLGSCRGVAGELPGSCWGVAGELPGSCWGVVCGGLRVPCGALWCPVVPCGALWCPAVPWGALWCPVVPCGALAAPAPTDPAGTGVAELGTAIPAITTCTFPPVDLVARTCCRALQGSSNKAPPPGWKYPYGTLRDYGTTGHPDDQTPHCAWKIL